MNFGTMTQFAPVAGIQIYEQMAQRGRLPNYHLLLTHDILARPDRYRTIFDPERSNLWNDRKRTIILDNSVAELGHPANIDETVEAANIVKANVIVLPDIYKKGPETIESCEAAYYSWRVVLEQKIKHPWSFMMVPQGRTLEEFTCCAEYFSYKPKSPTKIVAGTITDGTISLAQAPHDIATPYDDPWNKIHWWGIPRNMVEITGFRNANPSDLSQIKWHHGSRLEALQLCTFLAPWRAIHMLGFSDSIIDDWRTVKFGGSYIRGIDSAVPLWTATKGITFELGLTDLGSRPQGWLENAEYTELMQENINRAQWLFGGV